MTTLIQNILNPSPRSFQNNTDVINVEVPFRGPQQPEQLGTAPVRTFEGTGRQPEQETIPVRIFGGTGQEPQGLDDLIDASQTPEERSAQALEGMQTLAEQDAERDRNIAITNQFATGVKFATDVLNANSAYRGMELATQLNMLESRRLAATAIQDAQARGFRERAEGILSGEETALALAAQGQDVNSATVQRAVGSVEDIGLYNQLQQEISGVRQALGYDLEQVSLQYQLDQAGITRDFQIFSSALEFAGSTAGNAARGGFI